MPLKDKNMDKSVIIKKVYLKHYARKCNLICQAVYQQENMTGNYIESQKILNVKINVRLISLFANNKCRLQAIKLWNFFL